MAKLLICPKTYSRRASIGRIQLTADVIYTSGLTKIWSAVKARPVGLKPRVEEPEKRAGRAIVENAVDRRQQTVILV